MNRDIPGSEGRHPDEPARIRMKDVAERAGVHQTTVSLALRNHPRLPKKTRDKIQRIAREMGYVPDPALSALAAYRESTRQHPSPQVIALLLDEEQVPNLSSSHVHYRIIRGAHRRAEELGYKIEDFWYGKTYKSARALNRVLKSRNIQGLILNDIHGSADSLELDWDSFSVTKINFLPRNLRFDVVMTNHMLVVRLAMRKLRQMGCLRVGLAVCESDEIHLSNLFLSGYLVGQRHLAAEDRVPPFIYKMGDRSTFADDLRRWALDHRLEAFLSNWNNLDQIAWDLTHEDGLNCRYVPLDADWRTAYYGGVIQPHEICGERAVDVLVGQMKTFRRGPHAAPGTILINPLWKELAAWPPESLMPYDRSQIPVWALEHEKAIPPPKEEMEWSSSEPTLVTH